MIFFLSFLIFCLSYGVILVEEELLIIIASIFWVDAAGKLIMNLLVNELEYKGVTIKEKYLWLILKNKELQEKLVKFYSLRYEVSSWLLRVQEFILLEVIFHVINYFLKNVVLLISQNKQSFLNYFGLELIREFFIAELFVMNSICKENNAYVSKYTQEIFMDSYMSCFSTFEN